MWIQSPCFTDACTTVKFPENIVDYLFLCYKYQHMSRSEILANGHMQHVNILVLVHISKLHWVHILHTRYMSLVLCTTCLMCTHKKVTYLECTRRTYMHPMLHAECQNVYILHTNNISDLVKDAVKVGEGQFLSVNDLRNHSGQRHIKIVKWILW